MGITDEQIARVVALARVYGATRLILFGSALEDPEQARDLDLDFEGVTGWKLYELGARLEEELGVDREIASLIVPFTMVANRQGKIFLFAITSLFMAQLYGADLGVAEYAVVILGSSLAGMAAPGGGPMLVPSMAVVLSAINVPLALAFVIFTISGPIVDRMLSVLTVQASCLLATLSAGGSNTQEE